MPPKPKDNPKQGLNELIKQQAIVSEDWRHNSDVKAAYLIFDRLNKGLFQGKLPQPVIGFNSMHDSMKANMPRDVVYHYEGDDISLYHHIDIREEITGIRLIMAVLKGAIHLSQESYQEKQTWYYTAHFRQVAESMGMVVDSYGDWVKFTAEFRKTHSTALDLVEIVESLNPPATGVGGTGPIPHTPEGNMLWVQNATKSYLDDIGASELVEKALADVEKEWGQSTPGQATVKSPVKMGPPKLKGTSKMVRWSCDCKIIRASVEINMLCMDCGNLLVKG